jgi:hypothetical protein
MTEERKQEIINDLQSIYDDFVPTDDEPEITMFYLISHYNQTGKNVELIGGDWVIGNCSSPLKDLL